MRNKSDNKNQLPEASKKLITELMNTAENLYDKGDFTEAIRYYTQLMAYSDTLLPANLYYVLYMRGCAYKETGDITKAHKDWLEAQYLGFEHPLGVNLISIALAP